MTSIEASIPCGFPRLHGDIGECHIQSNRSEGGPTMVPVAARCAADYDDHVAIRCSARARDEVRRITDAKQ